MGANILVIEDNPASRDLITYLLSEFGHLVVAAECGETGLRSARRKPPDMIICDLHLPGIDGYEVVRRLKLDPALGAIPVVAVTALAMVGEREKVLAAGFDGYVSKPIDPETFSARLDPFLPAAFRSRPPATAVAVSESPRPARCAVPVTVLIVDGLRQNIAMLRAVLGGMGFRLLSAGDAIGALDLARAESPDLIVSDTGMAGRSGYDLLRAVRADPALMATPFVFVTASPRIDMHEAKAAGFAATVIPREIDPPELRRRILACLPAGLRPAEVAAWQTPPERP